MMMIFHVLPWFMQRWLGTQLGNPGSRQVWDEMCKRYFDCMSEGVSITWHSIHIPFGLSLDNATIHHGATVAMLTPRLTPFEEYNTILTAAEQQLGITIPGTAPTFTAYIDGLKEARRNLPAGEDTEPRKAANKVIKAAERAREEAVQTSTKQFLVNAKFRRFGSAQQVHAEAVHDMMLAQYMQAANANRDAPWEALFRRELAFKDPARWLCLVGEQLMPLGKTTPDLHQAAEMQVGMYKSVAREWTLEQNPDCPALLLSKSYDDVMHAECAKRNHVQADGTPAKNQSSIEASVRRLYITAQVVAAEEGEVFRPMLAPGYYADKGGHPTEWKEANFHVIGSGGNFPEAEWS